MNGWLIFTALLLLEVTSLSAKAATAEAAAPQVQTANPVNAAPVTDPALVHQHFLQVLNRHEYKESEEADVSNRFKEWLAQWFMRLGARFGEMKYASNIHALTGLFIIFTSGLAVVGLISIMVRLTRRRGRMEAEPSMEGALQKTFRPPETYDDEIAQAVRARDWHSAWLAAWRQFLSRLENQNLVEADRTRTNREYLAQLRGQTLPSSALALLTGAVDAYDRFIYGHRLVREPDWHHFQQQLNEAVLLLHLDDKGAASRGKPGAT